MAMDAKAFGPMAAKTAIQATPAVVNAVSNPGGAWKGFTDSGLGRLFTNPSSLTGGDAASLGGAALGLAAGFVDDPAAKAALATTGYAAGAIANPFMAAWGLPGFVGGIHDIIEGPETEIRRAKRTRDAGMLQGQTLKALFEDRNLSAPVGGSTAGDTLSAILNHNQAGTWFGDTGHNWYPDPAYGGLRALLHGRGFTGATEPRLNDVGGVGEIVAGAGRHLIPTAYQDAYEDVWRQQASGRDGTSGTYGGYTGAPAGALGWESLLRRNLDAPGPSYVMPEMPGSTPLSRANTVILPEYQQTADGGMTMVPKPSVEWSEDGQTSRNGVAVDPWEALLPAPPPGSSDAVLEAWQRKRDNIINNNVGGNG